MYGEDLAAKYREDPSGSLTSTKSDSILQPVPRLPSKDLSLGDHRPKSALPSFGGGGFDLSDHGRMIWNQQQLFYHQYQPIMSPALNEGGSNPISAESLAVDSLFATGSCAFQPPNADSLRVEPFLLPAGSCRIDFDEESFNEDLARILAWFREDLEESQKVSLVLSLIRNLEPRQLALVNQLRRLEEEMEESCCINTPTADRKSPPIGDDHHHSNFSTNCSKANNSGITDSSYLLFCRDLPGWLRSLRLHKYTPLLETYSPDDLLAITSESQLEALGIAAQGARNKLLRYLDSMRSSAGRQ